MNRIFGLFACMVLVQAFEVGAQPAQRSQQRDQQTLNTQACGTTPAQVNAIIAKNFPNIIEMNPQNFDCEWERGQSAQAPQAAFNFASAGAETTFKIDNYSFRVCPQSAAGVFYIKHSSGAGALVQFRGATGASTASLVVSNTRSRLEGYDGLYKCVRRN